MEAMPKTCKLSRYDYGSPGVLGYYHAQLNDVVQYPDARTELFHNFREFGNTILFCPLVEQALSQEETCDLAHTAAFQNILPRPFCVEGEKPEVYLRKLEAKFDSPHVVVYVEKLGSAKLLQTNYDCQEGDLLTRERLYCGLLTFKIILSRLRGSLDDPIWEGVPPTNGVMNIDEWRNSIGCGLHCNSFIPFLSERRNSLSSLNFASCTMIVLLGQQRRFEALDFCYHILRVQRVDGEDEAVKGINLKRMVDGIRRFQVLNSQIFATSNKYLKPSEHDSASVEQVRYFLPPILPSLAALAHYYRRENLQSQTVHNL